MSCRMLVGRRCPGQRGVWAPRCRISRYGSPHVNCVDTWIASPGKCETRNGRYLFCSLSRKCSGECLHSLLTLTRQNFRKIVAELLFSRYDRVVFQQCNYLWVAKSDETNSNFSYCFLGKEAHFFLMPCFFPRPIVCSIKHVVQLSDPCYLVIVSDNYWQ